MTSNRNGHHASTVRPVMTYSVTRRYTFDAAHRLPNHDGKCRNLHGHTYVVDITVSGPIQTGVPHRSSEGMVVDFTALDSVVKPLIDTLDHQYLNDVIPNMMPEFSTEASVPTAELIASYIATEVIHALQFLDLSEVLVTRVEVWETPKSKATVDINWVVAS